MKTKSKDDSQLLKTKSRGIALKNTNKKPFKRFNAGSLRKRMIDQLKGSRFRYINEQFYLSTSEEAKQHFLQNPDDFLAYHSGYKIQVARWPINPVDVIIKQIKRKVSEKDGNIVIADFGCGDAKIARSLPEVTVHSFDLVALNDKVKVCDMSHTSLLGNSVDIAVFCLSLMGTNLAAYIKEANRVLKESGLMKIAEVESRFEQIDDFIKNVEYCGFQMVSKDLSNNLFYFLTFKKITKISKHKKRKLPEFALKPCLYKKR